MIFLINNVLDSKHNKKMNYLHYFFNLCEDLTKNPEQVPGFYIWMF